MSLFKRNKYPKHLADDLSLGKQILVFFWEIFKVVVISLAIIIPVRYFLIKPFYVKGASMEPNFYDHEYLIIDEISYRFSLPERGDVVVFKEPFNLGQYFIKRIIGLPGEKIKILEDKIYIFNQDYPGGMVLQEDYLSSTARTVGQVEVSLAEDEYYLLGDNRLSSLDSRAFGPVKREVVVGKVLWRGWPLVRFGFLFNKIEYNL